MRNSFINRLVELAKTHPDLFLVCGDLGYSVLEPFAQQFPDRFLNAGVAEQNMTQVAAGLSQEGYNVFTYSIGNFPTLRCMEQIRYDVCYHQSNVKIVSVGGGYAYGPQGVSHHTTEDLGMLRCLPNMVVTAPGDPIEAVALADFFAVRPGPGYIRLNKSGEPRVHLTSNLKLELGQMIPVIEGKGTMVLACGAILSSILKEVKAFDLSWAVMSAPFVSPLDTDQLLEIGTQFESIITVEEHQANGGFGSSIVEQVSDMYAQGLIPRMPKIQRIAIPNKFIGFAGSQDFLRNEAGLSLKDYQLVTK